MSHVCPSVMGMTLIQTVFTEDRVIQVSDRRLTKGKSGELVDDFYTKLVLWNDRYTVGFTGIARVNRRQTESTAQWMAEILSDHLYFEPGVLSLRSEAGKRMQKLPKDYDRRLAIVLAGFDQLHQGPVVACITNMDMRTNRSADPSTFDIWQLAIPPGRRSGVHSIGATMNHDQNIVLTRYVRRALEQGDGVNPAVRLLVDLQRNVAKTDKRKTVGMDALCVHIPRATPNYFGPGPSVMSNLGGPDLPSGVSSFGFFDRAGWQWKQEAPLLAGLGYVKKHFASADPQNPDNQP